MVKLAEVGDEVTEAEVLRTLETDAQRWLRIPWGELFRRCRHRALETADVPDRP